jgi:heptosyltransferase-3
MVTALPIDPARVKRVLIYRLGSLGDTMVALPALHLVQRTFPQAQRLMLTNVPVHAKAPAASAILDGSGLVDGYIQYPMATRSPWKLAQIWWKIRRFRPDLLVYLTPPRGENPVQRDAKFFRFCGISRLIGLPIGDLARCQYDPVTKLWEREASRIARCVAALGWVDVNDLRNWDLRLTDSELRKAAEMLTEAGDRRLIVCGPGTKMQAKDWGQENWRVLLERLSAALPDHALILVGAADDFAVSEYASASWRGPVVNLCGRLTPRETAAVVKNAELFLGPDSGPMHLASAYGVPCAIAFAALDLPGRWFPIGKGHRPIYHQVECANCRLSTCIEQKKKCILSISVDEMFDAASAVMQLRRSAFSA